MIFALNRGPMLCAQDSDEHCTSVERIVWRKVVFPSKALSLDIE